MTMGEFLVRLTFYDDAQRSPVKLKVNANTTADQFYSKVTAEADVTNRYRLYYEDEAIQQCDTPLSQIFQRNPVDVVLVLMLDGGGPSCLISSCDKCPNDTGDDGGLLCEPSSNLTDDQIIDEIVDKREDAWIIFCTVFKISADVRRKIVDNSEDEGVRCIDTMHHIYHSNPTLTWDDVRATVNNYDPDLAKVIGKSI